MTWRLIVQVPPFSSLLREKVISQQLTMETFGFDYWLATTPLPAMNGDTRKNFGHTCPNRRLPHVMLVADNDVPLQSLTEVSHAISFDALCE
jgi:hypothetical protein